MKVILVTAIVFSTMIIINFLQVTVKNHRMKNNLLRLTERKLPFLISVIWMVVFFWSAYYLFSTGNYYNLVVTCSIVILSVLIGWFFLKDFIAGIIFRGQNKYITGDYVQFGKLEGNVESFSLTHISIHANDGKLLKIPYSRLSREIISQKTDSKTFQETIFILSANKKENRKQTELSVWNCLMSSPWRIGKIAPQIKFIDEDEQNFHFEIRVHVRNPNHLNYLTEAIEKRFGSNIASQ